MVIPTAHLLPQAAATQEPTPATPPAPTGLVVVGDGTPGNPVLGVMTRVPATRDEVAALRAQRSELSRQLSSAEGRRNDLVSEMEGTTGANRAGLEARVKLLDNRILAIEKDIENTGRLLTQTPGHLLTSVTTVQSGPFQGMRPDLTAISVVFTIFVLMPLAVAAARLLWKRASAPVKASSALDKENSERLQRLESAVDAIAIEMERVSEGQRFVTRLLAESKERVGIEAPRG